jgi:hypothetical protein
MIIIAKLDEVLSHILNINQDYTISTTIENFDLYDFTKKSRQVFHSNKHKCVKKNVLLIVEKLFSFEI